MPPTLVVVGSTNSDKIEATKRAYARVFNSKDELSTPGDEKVIEAIIDFEVMGVDTVSGVSNQPMKKSETFAGAKTRAWRAANFADNVDFGVGIEGGLHELVDIDNGDSVWIDTAIVVIYQKSTSNFGDNSQYSSRGFHKGIGESNGCPIPSRLMFEIRQGIELSFAVDKLLSREGTKNSGGWHSVLTGGHITLQASIEEAIVIAFTSLKFSEAGEARYGSHAFGE
jgi:non-canonical (house-cleaning) NTP pyrophosphatase